MHEQELQRGWQIHQQQRVDEAERIYRKVLAAVPQNANAWCFLGIALYDQRRYAEAVESYREALRIEPSFPIALNNLGNSLRYVNCIDEADACFQKAIDLKPDYLNAYKNRGTLHVWTGNLARGLGYYEQALQINPNEAELHRNLGVIYLLQGRFAEGWREYRWRWQVGDLHRPRVRAPLWDGQQPAGKRILLAAEQGLGDTLHFVRFGKLLRQQGALPIIHCQPPLMALLQRSPELGQVFPNNLDYEQPIDAHCSLLEVADLWQLDAESIARTFDSTSSQNQKPYLRAAPLLVNYWSARFPKSNKRRIGIAWQGNPGHQADLFRSVPLKQFESLGDVPGTEWLSLQSGFGVEQIASWQAPNPLIRLDENVDKTSGAFMDTAAIMTQLDLVITSDTAIAHLAGALGVPTWIVLNFTPDWRWLLDRDDSPWYPTVRLFRQDALGDWTSAFRKVRHALLVT